MHRTVGNGLGRFAPVFFSFDHSSGGVVGGVTKELANCYPTHLFLSCSLALAPSHATKLYLIFDKRTDVAKF